jgi:hypothetical protein
MHALCSQHVPVLADLANKIVELRQGAKRTPVKLDPSKPWEWTFKSGVLYDDLTLQEVAKTYSAPTTRGNPVEVQRDVSVDDVRDLIKTIHSVQKLPCVIDHWLWKHMIACDDL